MSNKIVWVLVAIAILIVLVSIIPETEKVAGPQLTDKTLDARLNEFADNIVSGGPPKDGIPPVDRPKYISVSESEDFLSDKDVIFVVESKEAVKIFPQKILVWHEIVNDVIDGEKVSVTYCPLTGSAVGFKGKLDEVETTFGTSGKLLNSNLVMYDRASDSYWPQILGMAVRGSQKGKPLEEFFIIWTTWEKAKAKYPDALVLSTDTGFLRSYGTDPYGSYLRKGNYYDSGGPFFPVMAEDTRLADKEVVIGTRVNNSALAIVKSKIAGDKVANVVINNEPAAAFYDDSVDDARVFSRQIESRVLNFEIKDGKIVDKETNSEWNVLGESIGGNMTGAKLSSINSFDSMWFAWAAFHPQTEIYR